ncbi:NAD(P)-dependent oxidoreductase [Nocardia brasiliensis]|uniref:NAD(P)-dependent oxidoreductase n=1 Tax=Nocardia brasiliensis TaxID=37326 RepID=UPI00366DB4C5
MTSGHTAASNGQRAPVTVLGLGTMGAAIAEVYLRGGYPTTVWNRSPGRAPQLDELGAVRADSLAEALTASVLTVVSIADTAGVAALLESVPEALAGRTVLNVSTGRPDEARELASWVAARQGRFLDGGILGMPATLGTPDALLPYSGSPEAHAEHGATIAELGAAKYLGADAGVAAQHDMAVLAGMYGLFSGFFQAAAMIGGEHTTARDFTATFLVPWLRELLDVLPTLAADPDSGEFAPTFVGLADISTVLRMLRTASRDQGIRTDLLDPLQHLFEAGIERGYGSDNLTRAISVLRESPVAA